jgi:Phosphate-selective porin O and P
MLGNVAMGPSPRLRPLFISVVTVLLLILPVVAQAQAIIKVNDTVFFRFGVQMQGWADELQSATTKGYAQNLFLRRARFLVTGQMAPNLTFFFQTDNPNAGKAPKGAVFGTFILQDAWFEWKLRNEFMLDGGEFLVPLSRNGLQSTISFLTLDISPTSTVFSAPTQSNGLRDTGLQAKGYLDEGRLEYRAAIFSGVRDAAARNPLRGSAYLQYDVFEKEVGYVYAGTNLGKRKILAISSGWDGQKDYRAFSGDIFTTIPVQKGNEFAGQIQAIHYDGGKFIAAIPRQNDYLVELAYYVAPHKIQPFAKFEDQKFGVNTAADQTRWGAGLNYYVSGQNLKFTAQYLHVNPRTHTATSNPTNEFTVQIQAWYY